MLGVSKVKSPEQLAFENKVLRESLHAIIAAHNLVKRREIGAALVLRIAVDRASELLGR